MNIEHVKRLQNLLKWIKDTVGVSANLEINTWQHKHNDDLTHEYRIWIDGLFNQSAKDSDMLIALIPYIKGLCQKSKIMENQKQLQGVAA